jgi:hypothetical protein
VPLSEIIEVLNERFGTQFTEEDRLFFQQIKEKACKSEPGDPDRPGQPARQVRAGHPQADRGPDDRAHGATTTRSSPATWRTRSSSGRRSRSWRGRSSETLFSLCSRHHRLWGYSSAAQTAHLLFGGRRVGIHHDLPSGLDDFCKRTGGCLGSPAEIALERTLLRYYRPFLEEHETGAAVQTMRGRSVAHLKFRLGLLTSRFRANHPLKACPECMTADVESMGWVYWHIGHQYPGVWVCPEHACWLRVSTVKSTGVERFLWHLPTEDRLAAAVPEPSRASTEAASRLARNLVALIEQASGAGVLQLQRVRPALVQRAAGHGWITRGGSLRMNWLRQPISITARH